MILNKRVTLQNMAVQHLQELRQVLNNEGEKKGIGDLCTNLVGASKHKKKTKFELETVLPVVASSYRDIIKMVQPMI